jgi:hypothetical protein
MIPMICLQLVGIFVLWMILQMLQKKSKMNTEYWRRRSVEEHERLVRHLEMCEAERRQSREELQQFLRRKGYVGIGPVDFDWRKEGF